MKTGLETNLEVYTSNTEIQTKVRIPMLQNDMKKGQTGVLKSGLRFRIEDNLKGNIRMATVYGAEVGLFTEMGSIYTSDIRYVDMPDGTREPLEQTPRQAKRSAKTQDLMKQIFGS